MYLNMYLENYSDDAEASDHQREGLQHVRKPPGLTVHKWVLKFQLLNQLIDRLRGKAEPFRGSELIKYLYRTFPQEWKDAYDDNNKHNLATATVK